MQALHTNNYTRAIVMLDVSSNLYNVSFAVMPILNRMIKPRSSVKGVTASEAQQLINDWLDFGAMIGDELSEPILFDVPADIAARSRAILDQFIEKVGF